MQFVQFQKEQLAQIVFVQLTPSPGPPRLVKTPSRATLPDFWGPMVRSLSDPKSDSPKGERTKLVWCGRLARSRGSVSLPPRHAQDASGTTGRPGADGELSPEGAVEFSPGRKPWGNGRRHGDEPRRGDRIIPRYIAHRKQCDFS